MSIFQQSKRLVRCASNLGRCLRFRTRLVIAMMGVVAIVTGLALLLAERNLRARQQYALTLQFQDQVRSLLAVQEVKSRTLKERCHVLAYSVRLRAALEEEDVEDLYRNALTELQGVFRPTATGAPAEPQSIRASFFRFTDPTGEVLNPPENNAGVIERSALDESLAPLKQVTEKPEEQSLGFIAVSHGNRPNALREVILTRIHDWDGNLLGSLVLGFPIPESGPDSSAGPEIKSGLSLNHQLYLAGLSAQDRNLLQYRLDTETARKLSGDFVVTTGDGPSRLFYSALDPGSKFGPAYAVCLYPLAASIRDTVMLRWKILGLGFLVLACGFGASLFVANNLSKPVDQIVAISAENATRRKQAERNLREVNQELEKALAELKATQQQVIQQERLSALGQMAAGIAHDFNNTLMPILGFSDVLLENPAFLEDKAETRRCLEMLRTSAKDAASVVSRLREFYRPAEADEEFPIVDLARLIEQSVALTTPKWRGLTQASGITVTVETEFKEKPMVAGEESALREVLTNLLFNAVDAMPDGGSIRIVTSIENEKAVIRVIDSGTGMSETVRQKCLEPFFSTKGNRGTGLGLSMVYGIIERHRGHLDIESVLGQGTAFIIQLPLAQETAISQSESVPTPKAGSSLDVLIVDDEARSRDVISAYLRADRHSVATAASGREALEKFRCQPFDLVVMDRAMPEMSGDQTARFMKQLNARVPVILLTGFGGVAGAGTAASPGVDVILDKPITLDALRRTIHQLVHAA